jgi:ketosteroid isomerase-like protein
VGLKINFSLNFFITCIILLAFNTGLIYGAEPFSNSDKQAIRSVTAEAVRMANSGSSWDEYTRYYYAPDAVILPPDAAEVRGHDAIVDFFEEFPPVDKMSFTVIEIEGRQDMAYVYGVYQLTMTSEDEQTINDYGKYLEIWKRHDDGSWKVAWDIFNTNPERE